MRKNEDPSRAENEKSIKTHDEIRIRFVPADVVESLKNISGKMGITLTAFLKKELRDVVNKYPEYAMISKEKNA